MHDGALWAYTYIAGNMTYTQIATVIPRFVRMRNVFNNILWEGSTDTEGKNWQVLFQQQALFPLTSLRVEVAGGTYSSVPAPSTPIVIDNLNLPGVTAPARSSVVTSASNAATTSALALVTYPNPTQGTTTISYKLPEKATVSLAVYNALGTKVATLIEESQAAGSHILQLDCTRFPTGVYFLRMTTPQHKLQRSLVVTH